jgi:hypothetical protein
MVDGTTVTSPFTITMIVKHGRFKCIECMNKGDKLHNVFTFYTKFLKYDLFWHWIKGICKITREQPNEVKFQGAFDVMDYYFTTAFTCNFEFVQGEMCYKGVTIENIRCNLWINIMFPPLQWDEFHLKAWSRLKGGPLQGHMQLKVECELEWYEIKVETI